MSISSKLNYHILNRETLAFFYVLVSKSKNKLIVINDSIVIAFYVFKRQHGFARLRPSEQALSPPQALSYVRVVFSTASSSDLKVPNIDMRRTP